VIGENKTQDTVALRGITADTMGSLKHILLLFAGFVAAAHGKLKVCFISWVSLPLAYSI